MMHNIEELYRINGRGYFTKSYITQNNIDSRLCKPVWWVVGMNELNVHTMNNVVIKVYVYGEKTWFDTKEERDTYRAMRNAEKDEQTKRNKIIKAITAKCKEMSTEELELLLKSF